MSTEEEMTCKELVEVLTDYIEGKLPQEERARLEAHLSACPYCETYLEQMRDTIEALGRLDEESIAPETREGLLDAFRGWRRG